MPQSMKKTTSKPLIVIFILQAICLPAMIFISLSKENPAWSFLPAERASWWVEFIFTKVFTPLLFLSLIVGLHHADKFRKYVRSKQGRLCPKCHYPTPGDLAEGQRCSECGVVFSGWMIREWNEMWKPKSSEMKAEIPAEKTD